MIGQIKGKVGREKEKMEEGEDAEEEEEEEKENQSKSTWIGEASITKVSYRSG